MADEVLGAYRYYRWCTRILLRTRVAQEEHVYSIADGHAGLAASQVSASVASSARRSISDPRSGWGDRLQHLSPAFAYDVRFIDCNNSTWPVQEGQVLQACAKVHGSEHGN